MPVYVALLRHGDDTFSQSHLTPVGFRNVHNVVGQMIDADFIPEAVVESPLWRCHQTSGAAVEDFSRYRHAITRHRCDALRDQKRQNRANDVALMIHNPLKNLEDCSRLLFVSHKAPIAGALYHLVGMNHRPGHAQAILLECTEAQRWKDIKLAADGSFKPFRIKQIFTPERDPLAVLAGWVTAPQKRLKLG